MQNNIPWIISMITQKGNVASMLGTKPTRKKLLNFLPILTFCQVWRKGWLTIQAMTCVALTFRYSTLFGVYSLHLSQWNLSSPFLTPNVYSTSISPILKRLTYQMCQMIHNTNRLPKYKIVSIPVFFSNKPSQVQLRHIAFICICHF